MKYTVLFLFFGRCELRKAVEARVPRTPRRNTVHQAFDLVEHRSPRPWLHRRKSPIKKPSLAEGCPRLSVADAA
jgi:hypothetical protein